MDIHLDLLLNFPNVTVQSCVHEDEGIYLDLEFIKEGSHCPKCHHFSDDLHRNRPRIIRDLSIFGKQTYLRIHRRQYYCSTCQSYFTERLTFIDWQRRYTQRYEAYIYESVQHSTVEQVSREEGLTWDQTHGIFKRQYGLKKNENWSPITRLSIDEISKRKGHKDFVTVVCDVDKGDLVEVIDSHKQDKIVEVLEHQPLEIRKQIKEVSVDMWGGFPKVIERVFPNAVVVIDRFHVMKTVNSELNKIRKQSDIKIKNHKFILLKNGIDLSEEEKEKLELILKQSERLRLAYELKESFREIYESKLTVEEGKSKIELWIDKAKKVYCNAITTITNHIEGICNYFLNRTTSGVMEGINNKSKLIKRRAYGFVNFDNFRMRLLA